MIMLALNWIYLNVEVYYQQFVCVDFHFLWNCQDRVYMKCGINFWVADHSIIRGKKITEYGDMKICMFQGDENGHKKIFFMHSKLKTWPTLKEMRDELLSGRKKMKNIGCVVWIGEKWNIDHYWGSRKSIHILIYWLTSIHNSHDIFNHP